MKFTVETPRPVPVRIPRRIPSSSELWENVQPLVMDQLADTDAAVYVYQTYVPGKKATEPT